MEIKLVREIDLLASLYPKCKENIEFIFDKGVNTIRRDERPCR
jgi:hypothetical protein